MANKTQGTEPFNAPEVQAPAVVEEHYVPPAPRPKTIERQGVRSEPYVHHMPQIRGGSCEWCGVVDNKVGAQFQYQLCPHFRGLGEMRCSYCDESKNPTEVVLNSVLNIMEHPYHPDQLVVVCNAFECSRKHIARFTTNH